MIKFAASALVVITYIIVNTGVHGRVLKPERLLKSPADNPSAQRVPTADGLFHFFELPIGQGDSQVIQCPNGDLSIVDLGSAEPQSAGFWSSDDIIGFLQGHFHRIKNIVITHNHADHYSFFSTVLSSSRDLSGLTDIYLSCTRADMIPSLSDWITSIQADDKIRLFNNGRSCGPNGQPCGDVDLCPGDPSVQVKIMAANMENCANANKNIDSVVFKIIHDQVTIMFNGDFGDYTTDQDENGPQKAMVDFYGDEMKVTAYKMAHHGLQDMANKRITCNAVAAKALFVSGNPLHALRSPRCDVIDRFQYEVRSLCKPLETNPDSEFYCGVYPVDSVVPDDRVQRMYTCGENSTNVNGGRRIVTDNEFAVYTTIPDQSLLNILEFSSDGVKWGFTNNIVPRLIQEED